MIRVAPDILKLDRTLVHGAHADPSRQALLEALIGFASSTGAAICAEGVENLADLRVLVSLDVSYAQGYGLCRPAPGWPQPEPGATAAGASEIRAGLRVSSGPRGAGAFARGLAELSDDLSAAQTVRDLGRANVRAAELLGADELALLLVEGNEIELVSRNRAALGERWSLDEFPSTRYVLEHRIPGQVVLGDEAGDPAELAELAELGLGAVLLVPVICGDHPLALLELYRIRPQAFTAREVDRARVLAQQFGAALDRLPD
jgi:GAF domain-containing protein